MALQHLRSSTANKRPVPGNMSDGQLGINTNLASPGLFFKDTNGDLVKVGPVHVGTTAPNASPAAGGTAGNSVGEQWLDTTGGTYVFKVWDGSAWRSESGTFVDVNGDVMTGALGIIAGSAGSPGLYFSGDTNTGIYSPGADQVAISTGGTGRLFVDSSGNLIQYSTTTLERQHRQQASSAYTVTNIKSVIDGAAGYLTFDTGANWTNGNAVERLRITSTGQLSHIGGGSSGSPAVSFNGSAPSNSFVVDSLGKVGIGTSSPVQLLEVENSSGNAAINITSSDTGYAELYFGDQSNASAAALSYEHSSNNLRIYNGGSIRAIIDSSGRVGIGTTNPGAYSGQLVVNISPSGDHLVFADDSTSSGASAARLGCSGNNLVFKTNSGGSAATERARIDSSGRLLVGTSSSLLSYSKLQVQGGAGTDPGGHLCLANENAAPSNATNIGSIRFTNNAGSIGAIVGCEADGAWTAGSNYRSRLVFSTTADGASSPTERMRINSAGSILSFAASANDAITAGIESGAGATPYLFAGVHSRTGTATGGTLSYSVAANGNVQNTNGSYTAISDAKLKENIVNAGSQWDDLKAIQIRNWNFKAETGHETHRQIGPIAQELETVCPGLVFETPDRDKDGNETGEVTKGVNQSVLYMKAVKALQEAMERIETLEAKVAALETA